MENFKTNSKPYYIMAVMYSFFVMIFRIVTIYSTKLICDELYNSANITIYKTHNESLIYEEALIYELPVCGMIFVAMLNFGILWASLEPNRLTRLILYGTLVLVSSVTIFVNGMVYGVYHNSSPSNGLYQLYIVIFEIAIIIATSFIFIANYFYYKQKDDKIIETNYDLNNYESNMYETL